MVEFVKKQISEKWTPMECVCGDYVEGKPQYLKDGLYFNYIFCPIQAKESDCGLKLHPELLEIYEQCNGMRLFLSSFCIYGLQGAGGLMEPYDIRTENVNIHGRMKENFCDESALVFFGSVCNDYVLAYREDAMNEIMCMENGSADVLKSFSSISEAVEFFVPRLVELYDDNHNKKSPNIEFSGIDTLENTVMDINELRG